MLNRSGDGKEVPMPVALLFAAAILSPIWLTALILLIYI